MINDVFKHELTANTFVITLLGTCTFLRELTRSGFQLFPGNTLSDKTLISEKFHSQMLHFNSRHNPKLSVVVGAGRLYQSEFRFFEMDPQLTG